MRKRLLGEPCYYWGGKEEGKWRRIDSEKETGIKRKGESALRIMVFM